MWGVDVHFNFLRAQGQRWGSCLFASMARCSSFCRDLHGDSHGWLLAQLGCLGTLQGTGQGMVPDLPVLVALARKEQDAWGYCRHGREAAQALLPPSFPSCPKPSLPVLLRSPKLFRSKACATPRCVP